MAIERTYIGARYVPILYTNSNGNNNWVSGVAYEALTMVSYNGATYTSKKPVPTTIGNPADNPTYWVLTGNYNSQIEHIETEITALESRVGDAEDNIDDLDTELSTTQGNLVTTQSDLLALAGRVTTAESQLSTVDNRINRAVNSKVTSCTVQSLNLNQNTVTTQEIIDTIGNNRGVVFVDYFGGSTAMASEIGTTSYTCVIMWVSGSRASGLACLQQDSASIPTKLYFLNHYLGTPARNTWIPVDKKFSLTDPITIDSSHSSSFGIGRQHADSYGTLVTLTGTFTLPNNDFTGDIADIDASILPAYPPDFAISGKQGFGRGYITTAGKLGINYTKVTDDANATVGFCVTYKLA